MAEPTSPTWPRVFDLRSGHQATIRPQDGGVLIEYRAHPAREGQLGTIRGHLWNATLEGAVYDLCDGIGRRELTGAVIAYLRATSWGAGLP